MRLRDKEYVSKQPGQGVELDEAGKRSQARYLRELRAAMRKAERLLRRMKRK